MTLREFVNVANILEPYLCEVFVDEYDERFDDYFPKQVKFNGCDYIQKKTDLVPYMDYEVVNLNQKLPYGELDCQELYLKKVEK